MEFSGKAIQVVINIIDETRTMKYKLTIELHTEPNPATPDHFTALIQNPNNKIEVLEVEEYNDEYD